MAVSPEPLNFDVAADNDGVRLDRCVAEAAARAEMLDGLTLSRARVQALIKAGHCAVRRAETAETIKDPSFRVKQHDAVTLQLPPPQDSTIRPEAIPLDILHEDDDLIVLNKPAGMVVHPAPGSPDGTLVNALLAHCGDSLSGIGGEKRPGIVHRLDKETSGIMVAAKNDAAHQSLSEQFAAHGRDGRMQRIYKALVWGTVRPAAGTVDAALARSSANRLKIAVSKSETAKHAVTRYRQIGGWCDGQVSLMQCALETGRTHQIRVHMAHIGHPLLGDKLYGSGMKNRDVHLPAAARTALAALDRQALHAAALGFEHPRSGEKHYWETDLPADLQRLVEGLG